MFLEFNCTILVQWFYEGEIAKVNSNARIPKEIWEEIRKIAFEEKKY